MNFDSVRNRVIPISDSPILWKRPLPEKLTGPQLVKKFPAFYVNHKFISAFTNARHLSSSSARSIQSMPPSYFLKIHFDFIFPSTPRSSTLFLSIRCPTKTLSAPPLPHTPFTSLFLIRLLE